MKSPKLSGISAALDEAKKIKASVRAKVEHRLFYIKQMFGYSKVRYCGLPRVKLGHPVI
jgi:uncharacterized membrane protein